MKLFMIWCCTLRLFTVIFYDLSWLLVIFLDFSWILTHFHWKKGCSMLSHYYFLEFLCLSLFFFSGCFCGFSWVFGYILWLSGILFGFSWLFLCINIPRGFGRWQNHEVGTWGICQPFSEKYQPLKILSVLNYHIRYIVFICRVSYQIWECIQVYRI